MVRRPQHRRSREAGWVLITIGTWIFLSKLGWVHISLGQLFLPAIFLFVGGVLVFRSLRGPGDDPKPTLNGTPPGNGTTPGAGAAADHVEFVRSFAMLSGCELRPVSRPFRGADLNAIMGGIPTVDEVERHQDFTQQVKLEPFNRALAEFNPEIWLTGIRREETELSKSLDIVSLDGRGITKVAPLFYWSEDDVEEYMARHNLPTCKHYFDPTKVHDGRECGLHTAA